MVPHPLHIAIGKALVDAKLGGCKVERDHACGGTQSIPLFVRKPKSNANEYCDVDILVLKGGRIGVIVEIEEKNILPTQICGKFLTSALTSCYLHAKQGNSEVCMGESVLFVQVVDTSKLKQGKTSKLRQFRNIMKSIRAILPLKYSTITKYRLFPVAGANDTACVKKIVRYVQAVCVSHN